MIPFTALGFLGPILGSVLRTRDLLNLRPCCFVAFFSDRVRPMMPPWHHHGTVILSLTDEPTYAEAQNHRCKCAVWVPYLFLGGKSGERRPL